MQKIAITLVVIFSTIVGAAIVIAAALSGMLPAFALVLLTAFTILFICAGGVAIYLLWTKARINVATARSIELEAAKIGADNSAVFAVPGKSLVQLQPGIYGTLNNLRNLNMPQNSNVMPALPVVENLQQLDEQLPTAPTFSQLRRSGWAPTVEKMNLGYSSAGPVDGSIDALLSTAIAGRPGNGKSSLLRFVYAQMLLVGGEVIILDPHGSIADDVKNAPATWNAATAGEMQDGANWIQSEIDRRLLEYRRGKRDHKKLLLLTDEFPVVSLISKPAVDAITRVILEARKVGIYALIAGQGLPADRFGGSLARDALSSRYVFKTTQRQASMAGLEKEFARRAVELEVGRAILDGPVMPTVVAIPLTTADDLEALSARSNWVDEPIQPFDPPVDAPASSNKNVVDGEFRILTGDIWPDDLQRAWVAFEQGATTVDKMQVALKPISTRRAGELLKEIKRARGVA